MISRLSILIGFVAFMFISCQKSENSDLAVLRKCNVSVVASISTIKTTYINKMYGTPDYISGFDVSIRNIEHSVADINEKFRFTSYYGNAAKIEGVTEGLNEFSAICSYYNSSERLKFDGWLNYITRIRHNNLDVKLNGYSRYLKGLKRLYVRYKCKDTIDISPSTNNIYFNMVPSNGRLSIVVENDHRAGIEVIVNGKSSGNILYNRAIAYIMNSDNEEEKDVDVIIKIFRKNNEKFKTVYKHFTYQPGVNKTRLISVK